MRSARSSLFLFLLAGCAGWPDDRSSELLAEPDRGRPRLEVNAEV